MYYFMVIDWTYSGNKMSNKKCKQPFVFDMDNLKIMTAYHLHSITAF
jgi:hypothetical protein